MLNFIVSLLCGIIFGLVIFILVVTWLLSKVRFPSKFFAWVLGKKKPVVYVSRVSDFDGDELTNLLLSDKTVAIELENMSQDFTGCHGLTPKGLDFDREIGAGIIEDKEFTFRTPYGNPQDGVLSFLRSDGKMLKVEYKNLSPNEVIALTFASGLISCLPVLEEAEDALVLALNETFKREIEAALKESGYYAALKQCLSEVADEPLTEYIEGAEYAPEEAVSYEGSCYEANSFMNQDSKFSVGPNLGQWTFLFEL